MAAACERSSKRRCSTRVTWSPDGGEIAYSAPAESRLGILRVGVAGGPAVHVPTPEGATSPNWSVSRNPHRLRIQRAAEAGGAVPSRAGRGHPGGAACANSVGRRAAYREWLRDVVSRWTGDRRSVKPGTDRVRELYLRMDTTNPPRQLIKLAANRRGRALTWLRDQTRLIFGSWSAPPNRPLRSGLIIWTMSSTRRCSTRSPGRLTDSELAYAAAGRSRFPHSSACASPAASLFALPAPEGATSPTWSAARNLIAYISSARPVGSAPPRAVAWLRDARRATPLQSAWLDAHRALGMARSPGRRRTGRCGNVQSRPLSALGYLGFPHRRRTPPRQILKLGPGQRGRGIAWLPDRMSLIIGVSERTSDIVLFDQGS